MFQLKKLGLLLGNILLFHLFFGHLVEAQGTFEPKFGDEKIHEFLEQAVNSNTLTNTSLDGLSRCFFHFIEYDYQFDYTSVPRIRPYIIEKDYPEKISKNKTFKGFRTATLEERKENRTITKIPKCREIFCVINVFLLSSSLLKRMSFQNETSDANAMLEIGKSPWQYSDSLYQLRFDHILSGHTVEVPELVKLNLFVVDWNSRSNWIWTFEEDEEKLVLAHSKERVTSPVLGAEEAKSVSDRIKVPTFLLVSLDSTIKGGLYYCPHCFDSKVGGFGFSCEQNQNQHVESLATPTSESCCSKMLQVHKKTVLFQRLSVFIEFSGAGLGPDDSQFQKVAQDQNALFNGKFFTPFHRDPKEAVGLDYTTIFGVLSAVNLTTTNLDGAEKSAMADSGYQVVHQSVLKGVHVVVNSGPIFIVGENRFRLITADSVRRLKTGLDIYVTPFQWAVWTTTLVAIATTTIAVLILLYLFNVGVRGRHERRKMSLREFGALCWDTFFWNSRILLEQCDAEFPPTSKAYIESETEPENESENKNKSTEKDWAQICRLILGMWLLMSIILTNGYKGVMKSDYAVKYPFQTEWQTTKDFLEKKFLFRTKPMDATDFWTQFTTGGGNFSIYYTRPNFPCNTTNSFLTRISNFEWEEDDDAYYAPYNKWHTWYQAFDFQTKCGDACSNTYKISFAQSNCTQIQACVDNARTLILFHNTWITCPQKLPEDIEKISRDQKSSKNTAVVIVPDRDFPRIWDIFKRMRNRSDISVFSNNKKVRDDDSFKDTEMYIVKSGVDRHFPLVMEKRMHQFLSSGIFWLWEKWDHRRFMDWSWNGGKTLWNVEEDVEPFLPLSFKDSDIALAFLVWTFCWLLSLGFLAVEISWTLKWRTVIVKLVQILQFIRFCAATCIAFVDSKFRRWALSNCQPAC